MEFQVSDTSKVSDTYTDFHLTTQDEETLRERRNLFMIL